MTSTECQLLDDFRGNLMILLQHLGCSQSDLCRAMGWPTSRLTDVLRHHSPKFDTVEEIAIGLESLGWKKNIDGTDCTYLLSAPQSVFRASCLAASKF